jgi:hypothetical protein
MTTMLTVGDRPEQTLGDGGGRDDVLVVGTTPGHSLKRAVHGSVSAYCSKHLPGRVAVVGAGDPGPLASSQSSQALAGDQARGHRRRFRAR